MKNGKRHVVLVAGGAGFLGSHLCDALLADGADVVCLDNFRTGRRRNLRHLEREPRFEIIEADVVDALPARFKQQRGRIDRIFNLACPASPPHYQADPEHTMLTSVVGTCNLLRLAERMGARFLLASTSEVYGDPGVHPQPESYWGHVNPIGPRSCYDEGKRCAETLFFDYWRQNRLPIKVVRIFNTYGPRTHPNDGRVVSSFIVQALRNQDITIFGKGEQTRSFCYVDDLIRGLIAMMETGPEVIGPINLGNPAEFTIRELAELILELTGSRSKIVHRPLPQDDPQKRRPDISEAESVLGWRPTVALREGLAKTIPYFEQLVTEADVAARAQ